VLFEEGVRCSVFVGVGEGVAVSLGVGEYGRCVGEEGVRSSVVTAVGEGEAVSLGVGVCAGGVVEDDVGVLLASVDGVDSMVTVSPGVKGREGVGDCVGVEDVSVEKGTVPGGLSGHGIARIRLGNEKADRKKINPASRTGRAGRLIRT
jgi:hypothetical protein